MNTVLRADNSQYLITLVLNEDHATEDLLTEEQKHFQNYCIFHEDKPIQRFVDTLIMSPRAVNFKELTVINKHKNYGIKWEKVTT